MCQKMSILFISIFILIKELCDAKGTSTLTTPVTEPTTNSNNITIKPKNCTEFSTKEIYWITFDGYDSCYYFKESYSDRITYYEALEKCEELNATLALIHDFKTNYLLSHREFGDSSDMHWIGLNSLYKRGIYQWLDNTPLQFTNFTNTTYDGDPIPPDVMDQGRCVALSSPDRNWVTSEQAKPIGAWYKQDCNEKYMYICERVKTNNIPTPPPTQPGYCLPDWNESPNDKCVKYINVSMNYTLAREHCFELGAELLSIHSEEEQDFITAMVAEKPSPYIGFHYKIIEQSYDSWFWDDQTKVSYTNWGFQHNEYDKHCTVIVTNITQPGKWVKVYCNEKNSVFCIKNKDPNMTNPGITNKCKIHGFENFIEYRNSCYYIVDTPSNLTSFFNAESNCMAMNGAHLLSIVDPFEKAFLNYYLKEKGKSDNYWIGLHSTFDSERNVSQIFEWTDEWPVYVTSWDKNEPQFIAQPKDFCVSLLRNDSKWRTGVCDTNRAYICKTTTNPLPNMDSDKSGVCPQQKSITWVNIDRRSKYCYLFSVDMPKGILENPGLLSWSDASYECRRRNATLASIHSNHVLELLRSKLINQEIYQNTWIGLTKNIYDNYLWEDGSALDFTNWDRMGDIIVGSDDPTHGCAEVSNYDLTWNLEACTGSPRDYFICEIRKIYSNSTSIATPTTTQISKTSTTHKSTTVSHTTTQHTSVSSQKMTSKTTPMTKTSTTHTTTYTPLISKSVSTTLTHSTTQHKSISSQTTKRSTIISTMNGTELQTSQNMSSKTTHINITQTTPPMVSSTEKGIGKQHSSPSKGLSSGEKVGIAFGTVIGVVLIIAIVYIAMKKYRPSSSIVQTIDNSFYLSERNIEETERTNSSKRYGIN